MAKLDDIKSTLQGLKKGRESIAPDGSKATESVQLNKYPIIPPQRKLAKNGKNYIRKGIGKGGIRPGAGRIPNAIKEARAVTDEKTPVTPTMKQWKRDFLEEVVDVAVTDKDGQRQIIKRPRFVVILHQLYNIGLKDDPTALYRLLEQGVGRPPQPIRGDEEEDTPVRIAIDINSILEKAYGDEN